jgi:hypothetical protein
MFVGFVGSEERQREKYSDRDPATADRRHVVVSANGPTCMSQAVVA